MLLTLEITLFSLCLIPMGQLMRASVVSGNVSPLRRQFGYAGLLPLASVFLPWSRGSTPQWRLGFSSRLAAGHRTSAYFPSSTSLRYGLDNYLPGSLSLSQFVRCFA